MNGIRTAIKQRNRSLTFRFVFFVGILVMAVLVLVASFLVVLLSRQVHQERIQVLRTSLSHTDVLFSQHLNSMEVYCQELYSTDTVRRIRTSDELSGYEQARASQEIQNGMRNMSYIHSVYVINQNGNCNFHTTNSTQFLEDLSHKLPEQLEARGGSLLPFLWTVGSRYSQFDSVVLFSMYMQVASIGGSYYTGTLVVNYDLSRLSDTLFSSVENSDILQYYILDHRGTVIAHSKDRHLGADFSTIPAVTEVLQGNEALQSAQIDGTSYEIIGMSSQYPGYYIVAQSLYQPQSKLTSSILLIFPLAILTLCMFCMCVSYMVGKKMFSPLRSLISVIRHNASVDAPENYSGDELQYLNRYYHHISAYIERLRHKDEKNLIVKHLLLGNNVQPLLVQKHILYPEKSYCAALIYMLEDAKWESLSDYYQWHSNICETISYSFRDICQCSWFEIDFHRMLFLLTLPPSDNAEAPDLSSQVTQTLQKLMESLFSERVLVYVTYSSHGQEDLLSFYRKMDGQLRTTLCLSSSATGSVFVLHPNNNEEACQSTINMLSEQIQQQVLRENREAYLELLNTLLDTMSSLIWEDFTKNLEQLAHAIAAMNETIPEHAIADEKFQQLYKKIKSAHERQTLLDCFLLLYDEIILQRQRINTHSAFHTIEYAVSYIQNNYADSDLNMAAISHKMNISPSYFGKLFHDYTGKSVSEYLTTIRLEKARELLLQNPERSIVDISADVGYPNPGYFSTKFKKHYGVSPSSLRSYSAVVDADKNC